MILWFPSCPGTNISGLKENRVSKKPLNEQSNHFFGDSYLNSSRFVLLCQLSNSFQSFHLHIIPESSGLPLQIDGWKTILSFWVLASFPWRTVCFREGRTFDNAKGFIVFYFEYIHNYKMGFLTWPIAKL